MIMCYIPLYIDLWFYRLPFSINSHTLRFYNSLKRTPNDAQQTCNGNHTRLNELRDDKEQINSLVNQESIQHEGGRSVNTTPIPILYLQ